LKMADTILLIQHIPGDDGGPIEMKKVGDRVDIVSVCPDSNLHERIAEKAFDYAHKHSKRVVVLQVLTSNLYHWGSNDNILSGPAKMRFIGHVREEVFSKSLESKKMLEEKALRCGTELEIHTIETRDPVAAVLNEARGEYDRIFMVKERKRLFPIFKKTIAGQLQKQTAIPVSVCQ
jgi:hypothetical protein